MPFFIYVILYLGESMSMQEETYNRMKKTIEEYVGIPYEEFEKLDLDEQEALIASKRKPKRKTKNVKVMIGSGENSFFMNIKRGERYMLADGTFVRAGITREEDRMEMEDALDDIFYSKPVALAKKIKRRIIKNN